MRLSLFNGVRPFGRGETMRNSLAGVTLASMNIPQVLAGVVVLVLLFLTGPRQYLPRCVLAGMYLRSRLE